MQNFLKSGVLWSISRGLHLPQSQLDRVNELSFLKMLLGQLEIDCVLDVGANRGQFAEELRRIGYCGQIVSFEPIASEFLVMKTQRQHDRQWTGYSMALGSKEETMSITIPKLTVMSSLLEFACEEKNTRIEQIEVRRLDTLFPDLQQKLGFFRPFLKMDTQGYDLEVFRGAAGCIGQIRGMQSELSVRPLYKNMPHYLEALAAYEHEGFDLYNLSVVNRVSNGGLLELNCFMRRGN